MQSKLLTERFPLVEAVFVFTVLAEMKTLAIRKKWIHLHGSIMSFPITVFFQRVEFTCAKSFIRDAVSAGAVARWNWERASRSVVMWRLACFLCGGFMSWEVWEACAVNKSLLFRFVSNLNFLNLAAVLNEVFPGWPRTLADAVSDLQLHPWCIGGHFYCNLCPLGLILSVVPVPTWLSQRSLHLP